jgi:class 3 adenylate cyclase
MSRPCDVCVLFADIAGSTRLYETLGDTVALRTIERCLAGMRHVTSANGGRVVKTIGDEVMAVFDTAAQGMQAAGEMLRAVDALPPPAPGTRLALRAGFHFGPALCENDDVFGDTVNTAARMTGLAKAGQIVTTAETVAALPAFLRGACRAIDALAVRGKADVVNVCEVIWQEGADLTMVGSLAAPPPPVEARLVLRLGGAEWVLGPARPAVTLGRDPGCDIVVQNPRASRLHARIERRRDKYVLVDLSSNGSFVGIEGEAELVLRREEMILRGRGYIVFGAPRAPDSAEVLAFALEGPGG